MKKLILAFTTFILLNASIFAQSDLQVLAVVKYNKSESISVKQVKNRCEIYQKQVKKTLNLDEKKTVLETLIEEKLLIQAAQKSGITIPDSIVDQYFIQSMSQSLGAQVTEKQLTEIVQNNFNMSLDAFLLQQTGMNVADYKSYLKNQLYMQQYVVKERQNELQRIAPTDEEIRTAYESSKSSFVWNDMLKVFLIIVPKGQDENAAKIKINNLINQFKDKKLSSTQIALQSEAENSGYQAGEIIVPKNESSAAGLGMTFQNLLKLFSQNVGYSSEIQETDADYRFISILNKYDAKMLGISDIVQPDTTVTVYDYIRSSLTQQKQQIYIQQAVVEISKQLNTAENVERKKTGAALDKLLDWGE